MIKSASKPLGLASGAKKVTVKLNQELKRELPMKVLRDGYNMRQKSKWVTEAIQALLSRKGWEGALLSEIIGTPDDQDVFTIPTSVVKLMNEEARRINVLNPSLKATQSTIIRAAINRRRMGF